MARHTSRSRDPGRRAAPSTADCTAATPCPDKQRALDCFHNVADMNKDGRVSRHELVVAIDNRLPWWKRTAFHLFGGIDKIMADCDANQDDYLTRQDALERSDVCMETCFKRQATIDTFEC